MSRVTVPVTNKASDSVGAATEGKADFRLLRYFTTASLLVFVVVAVLLGYVFRTCRSMP